MHDKRIFISHSTKDRLFAEWMSDFLVCFGVDRESIFCSSDYRSGVSGKIPDEIARALEDTVIDIVILSGSYKQSEYCLNEAGIIWFKGDKSEKIIVVIPEIFGEKCAGFMDTHYKQYRILDADFFDALTRGLENALMEKQVIQPDMRADLSGFHRQIERLERFQNSLPIVENLSVCPAERFEREKELQKIKRAWENIQRISYRNPDVMGGRKNIFYKSYGRTIVLYAAKNPGKIKVETTTECVIVNLSDEAYTEVFSAQFLRHHGGHDTYREIELKADGAAVKRRSGGSGRKPSGGAYLSSQNSEVVVKAHSSAAVKNVTIYEIEPELFFQSKVLHLPCGAYSIQANFDVSFIKRFGTCYIFRSQFIPPDPGNLDARLIPHEIFSESPDKRSMHYRCEDGFPAGSGYVLTISKIRETRAKRIPWRRPDTGKRGGRR